MFLLGILQNCETPRFLGSFLCTWFAFQKPTKKRLRTVIMQIYHVLMLLGHSTTTPSPWTKSSKGLLGFALFADKFLMSVATFDVHP